MTRPLLSVCTPMASRPRPSVNGTRPTATSTISASMLSAAPPAAGGAAESIEADIVLVAVGRVPFTEGLGLEAIGVQTDNKGRVIVDGRYATNVGGIYAIGDV